MLLFNKYLRLNRLILYVLPLLLVVFILSLISPVHADSYNYTTYLMDDNVFENSSTMSAAQIQAFLVNEGSGLASFSDVENCGSTSGPNYSYYAKYYSCGSTEPASTIIYDASQAYGINPQALLATMQKEQSLVTTPNPTSSQLDYAMGYGCADSSGCTSNSYPGFFTQVDNAAWQFRADMELGSGNSYWGYSPSSYPCGSPTKYYSAPLTAGSNVTFYDDYGNAYTNFTMPNMSTATLYCYTPHVYPGSSQEYYSGSYWFDYYYNLWFGSPFFAKFVSQSSEPIVPAGTSVTLSVEYQNIGNSFWKDNVSTFPGYPPIHLATTNPINRSSMFYASNWLSSSRPTGTFSAVYDSNGTLDSTATANHTVQPGQIAQFTFTIHIPITQPPGVYREYFQPIAEGYPNWNMNVWSYFDIGVTAVNNQASYSSESSPVTLTPGGSAAPAYFRLTNTGNTIWYDNTDTPVDMYPVHLATTWPINRWSLFDSGWPAVNRPDVNFSKVYNRDGSLASNQHLVLPGQTAEFDFNMQAPAGTPSGYYQEYFQPILEGAPGSFWNMGGVVWQGVTVN